MMKLSLKILMGIGIALLFSGCTGSSNTVKPLHQQQKYVWHAAGNNKYYYIPRYSFGGVVRKPWQYKNKVETSGFLECPVGYALQISMNEKKKLLERERAYRSILNAKETKTYDTHPTITPKSNSKEYKKMVAHLTEIYRRGNYACIRPMTNKEVKQYKAYQAKRAKQIKAYRAQQAKINNDPRVVAARINAQASRQRDAEYRRAERSRSLDNFVTESSRNLRASQPINVNMYHY